MSNIFKIKADVINELRNKIYYNQMEIERLLNNPINFSHKKIVRSIKSLLKTNIISQNSIDLLEIYIPNLKTDISKSDQQNQMISDVISKNVEETK